MRDNLLTWNVRNWVTVVLMALLGWLILTGALRALGIGAGMFSRVVPSNAPNNPEAGVTGG